MLEFYLEKLWEKTCQKLSKYNDLVKISSIQKVYVINIYNCYSHYTCNS